MLAILLPLNLTHCSALQPYAKSLGIDVTEAELISISFKLVHPLNAPLPTEATQPGMEMEVRDAEKKVLIWLTRAESNSVELREALKPIYREFRDKKYLVAVFESGTEDLEELTRDLVLYNRTRLRELEMAKEKRASGE